MAAAQQEQQSAMDVGLQSAGLLRNKKQVVEKHRELRQSFFCRCVADYETFYDDEDDEERRHLTRKSKYFKSKSSSHKAEEHGGGMHQPHTRAFSLSNHIESSGKYYSSENRSEGSDPTMGSEGYYIVDSITVLPLENDACRISKTNAALHAFLRTFYSNDDESRTSSSTAKSFWSLFNSGGKRNRRQLNQSVRNLKRPAWDERRKSALDSRSTDPIFEPQIAVQEEASTQIGEMPRVFPCPAPTSETSAPSVSVDTVDSSDPPSSVPSASQEPSAVASEEPTSLTQSSPVTEATPTAAPSLSLAPSISEDNDDDSSTTAAPSLSSYPSNIPSNVPSLAIEEVGTEQPTLSDFPSISPSFGPTVSEKPSFSSNPTNSPIVSNQPTTLTVLPTLASLPTAPPVLNIEQTTPVNDQCINAISLPLNGTEMVGSTTFATYKPDYRCGLNPYGGVSNDEADGIWYKAVGNGNIFEVSTCSNETNFDTAIQAFSGTCVSKACVPGAGTMSDRVCSSENYTFSSRIRIETLPDVTYWFYVFGRHAGATGKFGITLKDIATPPNDSCATASPLNGSNQKIVMGTTANATIGQNRECGLFGRGGISNGSPGVWYVVVGTGATFEVSTCAGHTDFDTAVQVMAGSCGRLSCVAGAGSNSDERCVRTDGSSRTTFTTVLGENYYIHVFGNDVDDSGRFVVVLDELES